MFYIWNAEQRRIQFKTTASQPFYETILKRIIDDFKNNIL